MATRYEKVVLDIESSLASVMARDAAAAKLLERSLNDLSGTSTRTSRSVSGLDEPLSKSAVTSSRANKEIDRLSGRLRLLADTAAILGPALIPIGAVGIPAITGLAAQFGAAAFAGGTAILAFQGVGDTLKKVNAAALEPTAANLEAARIAMQKLSPEARSFVTELRALLPALTGVRNAAAAGLFPGLEASLMDLESMLPRFEDMVYRIGDALGSIAEDSAESLAGPRWRDFISFIESEVPQALGQMATIVGSLAHGLSELWMAFDPLNDSFASWMADAAQGFDSWAQGLSQSGGFNEFIAYIRENGPRVADALSSIGNALLQIVEAAAPLGGPVLQALSVVADVIADIAGSDAGPAIMGTVTALALLSRGMKTFEAVSATSWATSIRGAETFTGKMQAAQTPLRRGAGALAGIAIASTGAADGLGLSNTASMALLGTLGGPWGAAVGGAVGLALDFGASQRDSAIDVDGLTATLNQQTGAITENTHVWAAKQLEEDGLLAEAERMGLSLEMVTNAALGQKDAITEVNDALNGYIEAGYTADQSSPGYAAAVELATAADDLQGRLGDIRVELDGQQGALVRVAAASGRTADGFSQAASAAEQFRAAVERVNRILEQRANVRDFEAAIDDLTDSLKENGRTLDVDTKKGRANQAALDAIAASAFKVAEGMKGTNRVSFLLQARKDFIDAAQKLGLTTEQAQRLADKLGLLGRTKAKPEIDVDTANAHRAIDGVQAAINRVQGKTVTITVRRSGDGVPFTSGGGGVAPRATTTTPVEASPTAGRTSTGFSFTDTFAKSIAGSKVDPFGTVAVTAHHASSAMTSLADMTRHEIVVRERLLTKELEHAEKRMQRELEELRALKDARRALVADTASNFMSGLFGEGSNLSSALSTLSSDSTNAQQFAAALQQLSALGFDGGAYAELATSGNLSAAQSLIAGGVGGINALEAAYEVRAQNAQTAGQIAGGQVWGEAIKEQTRALERQEAATNRVEQELKAARKELRQIEKAAAEKGPDRTARGVGREINNAVVVGHKGRI